MCVLNLLLALSVPFSLIYLFTCLTFTLTLYPAPDLVLRYCLAMYTTCCWVCFSSSGHFIAADWQLTYSLPACLAILMHFNVNKLLYETNFLNTLIISMHYCKQRFKKKISLKSKTCYKVTLMIT